MASFEFSGLEKQAISFTARFDGQSYKVDVKWSLAGQRWYVTITDQGNRRILTKPLIDSAPGKVINIVFGIFKTTVMYWNVSSRMIEVEG